MHFIVILGCYVITRHERGTWAELEGRVKYRAMVEENLSLGVPPLSEAALGNCPYETLPPEARVA